MKQPERRRSVPRARTRRTAMAGLAVTALAVFAATLDPGTPASAVFDPDQRPTGTIDFVRAAGSADSMTPTEITLLTGDRVRLGVDDGELVVEDVTVAARRDGRAVAVHTFRQDDDLYVIPADALSLLAAHRLDRQLFNVTQLAESGYAGADGALPLIVQYDRRADARPVQAQAEALPASTAGPVLESIDATAVRVETADAAAFWSAVKAPERAGRRVLDRGLARIWLDQQVEVTLDESVSQIGAPDAWAAGYDGEGVTVGVLDTGIDAGHPDVAGQIVASRSFVPGAEVADGHGHGTHVAATIAGAGAASDGRYTGVAPGADLVVGKVLSDEGSGGSSGIIDGMEWAAAQGAEVISMSLGSSRSTDGTDPMSQAVDRITAEYGTLFVVAAGNSGPDAGTVRSPGAASAALTVAAVDKSDKLASFSSRGPRVGDLALKPEIAAPGVSIVAARAAGTDLGGPVDEQYTAASGTSMATPHVAGAAAILAQQHPGWSADQLKDALASTAADGGYLPYEQGTGRLDVSRASAQNVYADSGLHFGHLPFPQSGPVTESITYVNHGDEPVTLDLTVTMSNFTGEPASEGMFTLGDDQLTVPAGGNAQAEVTLDPGVGGPEGYYQGTVRATGTGGVRVTTAVAADVEPESHLLTVEAVAPQGATDVRFDGWLLVRNDGWVDFMSHDVELPAGAEGNARVPDGSYTVVTSVSWRDAAGEVNHAMPLDPEVKIDGDTTLRFDLREAKRVQVDTPRTTESYDAWFGYQRSAPRDAWELTGRIMPGYGQQNSWVLPTDPVTAGELHVASHHLLGPPVVTMDVLGAAGVGLHPLYQSPDIGVGKLDVHRPLPVMYAGQGLPDDLTGVDAEGSLVVLTPSDVCGDVCEEQVVARVAAAAEAGAAGVLIAGPNGRVDLDEHVYPIPTLSLPAAEAGALIERLERRPVKVRIGGATDLPFVYAVKFLETGRVPADVVHRVTEDDVARVENHVHADEPGVSSLDWARLDALSSSVDTPTFATPRRLTVYAGTLDSDAVHNVHVHNVGDRRYGPGEEGFYTLDEPVRHDVHWNSRPIVPGPPVLPESEYLSDRLCSGCREGNMFYQFMYLTTPEPAHQTGHLGLGNEIVSLTCADPGRHDLPPERTYTCEAHLYDEDGTEIEPRIFPEIVIGLSERLSGVPGVARPSVPGAGGEGLGR